MMEAILIGESGKLEKVWTDHFRRTGTYHALVISGLHVTVLAGVLLFLLRLCMLKELPALAIAAVAAWIYAAVSGWSAPVIRAAGGFTLYLIGRYFFRRGRVLNLLAAIGIAYLLYDPGQILDASFQLSFFSVAAIGALAVPLLDATSMKYAKAPREIHDLGRDVRMLPEAAALRVELRLLAETVGLWTPIPARHALTAFAWVTRVSLWVYEMAVVSATVQIALALPMALYFHRISVTGITANLVIVPLLSAVVPVGFAAIFTGFPPFAWAALVMLRWSEAVAGWHVRLEPSLRVPDPPLWLGFMLVAMLTATAFALRIKSTWRWPSALSALALFAVLFACPFAPELAPGILELTMIDVGQGDSLFVSLPDGRTMLVDAGGIPAYGRKTKPRMDIGEDVVSPYLWTRRIRHVDIIAVSHAHEDHIGGLVALLDNFRPGELWTGATPDDERWRGIENHARALGIRVLHRHAGQHSGNIDIIAPPDGYEPGSAARNNDSLAMRITYGEHSFLLMGDMEKQIEYRLVAANALAKTTVLKVAHHGSRTSSTEDFLNATQPALALISAGYENSFHHPHPDVLERLADHHTSVLRTDAEGLVTVRTDGHRLSVIRTSHDPSRLAADTIAR
jgi:competence protein ComEC